jgi:hypothetical protein
MKSQYRIAILITYFGDWPWYFSFFIHSCKFNAEIDFFIFCDQEIRNSLPDNVTIVHKSLGDIQKITSDKMGFTVSIEFPYKLCDYKPAYGLIFEEYISDYDFWGQSDIDIIYGNLRNFFSDELLSTIDYASVRHDYTTGCFSLFRNNSMVNNLFKMSKDYRHVFTTKDYLAFEELNFKHCEITNEKRRLEEIETDIECFTQIIKKAELADAIKAHFDFILLEGVPGKIKFDRGELTYNSKYEVALYHLYWFKQVYKPKRTPVIIPDIYNISPTKIYSQKSKPESEIQK